MLRAKVKMWFDKQDYHMCEVTHEDGSVSSEAIDFSIDGFVGFPHLSPASLVGKTVVYESHTPYLFIASDIKRIED